MDVKNKFETLTDQDAGPAALENLDSQVRNFEVPAEFMAAARKFSTEVASEGDLQKWNGITADWKILADSSPLYPIALKFVEAEKMSDSSRREAMIKSAREEIRKYLGSGEKGPKFTGARDWSHVQ